MDNNQFSHDENQTVGIVYLHSIANDQAWATQQY